MKFLYFDCFAGIAGDMTVGALLELGLPLDTLREQLAVLPFSGYTLESSRAERHGVTGTSFRVRLAAEDQPHRHYSHIARMIDEAPLSPRVKELSQRIFRRLAEAEATVHGVPMERVHFHEVGAVDSIVDIVGAAIGLDYLGIDRVCCSPLPYGRGFVKTAHGLLPVPAPATAQLLTGIPLGADIGEGERVTPTGAAIVAALAESFGPPPAMTVKGIGHGAGEKDFPEVPNLLRIVMGEDAGDPGEEVMVLETHLDDVTPEILGFLMERLFAEGALDAAFSPLQMKKNRPGTRLTVVARREDLDRLARLVLAESTAIGVRYYPVRRLTLGRKLEERETSLGTVRVKVLDNGRITPEFESCREIALARSLPLLDVYRIVEREIGAP
ncbi:nickel pincer cofactor biosynthesis protein LarC [Geomonas sp. Red32]|uniref:nickel pincer cofactor biosynthesis protein LarC n=1 Tax=Geomonas sp. Red32 TaxID=2912856 RepID=UPI00202CF739|nr:nickel pincer cofactor biosynthesis protein LarC [Geomonas sp. Red32]MCM0081250.1 nickel pincer cofactor biosynthesis protein LarC [Geomonas sp. Red32]